MTAATDSLNMMIAEDRVIRGKWTGSDANGRETACLLAALSVEVRKNHGPQYCPADLMPRWMAHLTVFIDDAGTLKHWPEVIRRYAALAERWHVLAPEAWRRADWRCKRASVLEAKSHTANKRSVLVCDKVIALLDRAINGTTPPIEEWEAARKEAAKWAEAEAAEAAKWAAEAAAEAAKWAAEAAEAAEAAAKWAAEAAKWAADRMIDAFLDILEDEIKQAECSPPQPYTSPVKKD